MQKNRYVLDFFSIDEMLLTNKFLLARNSLVVSIREIKILIVFSIPSNGVIRTTLHFQFYFELKETFEKARDENPMKFRGGSGFWVLQN
jgi:hypothetical protein